MLSNTCIPGFMCVSNSPVLMATSSLGGPGSRKWTVPEHGGALKLVKKKKNLTLGVKCVWALHELLSMCASAISVTPKND